jgi:hypothetical protein
MNVLILLLLLLLLQALQDAEQKRSQHKGDPGADKAWTRSFVTAVNHLVNKKALTAAAAAGADKAEGVAPGDDAAGDQDDVRSMVSR